MIFGTVPADFWRALLIIGAVWLVMGIGERNRHG